MTERIIIPPPVQDLELQNNGDETSEKATYPLNSAQLWAHLLYDNHPEVTQIILAYYYADSRYKDEVRRFDVQKLKAKGYLTDGSYPPPTISPLTSYNPLLCSISSIVGTTESNTDRGFGKPHRNPHLRLTNPRSFIQLDLSCEINKDNMSKVINALDYLPYDWYLLQSNISYHAVVDHTAELNELPFIWGDLLQRFSQLSDSEFIQLRGSQLAESLRTNGNSIIGLRLGTAVFFDHIFREVREMQGGYEEFKKQTFIDWGHMNHSLKNFIEFNRGQSVGLAFLRISGKKDNPQPILVAQRVDQSLTRFEVNSSYFTRQPSLFN